MENAATSFLSAKERTVLEQFHERLRKAKGKKSEVSTTALPPQRSGVAPSAAAAFSGSQCHAASASDSQPIYSTYLVPNGSGTQLAESDASRVDRSLRSSGRDKSVPSLHWHSLVETSRSMSPRQPPAVPSLCHSRLLAVLSPCHSPQRHLAAPSYSPQTRSPRYSHEANAYSSLRADSHVFSRPGAPPLQAICAVTRREADSPQNAFCVATRSRHRNCSESSDIVVSRHEKTRRRSSRSQSRSKSPFRWGKMYQSSTASSSSPLRVEHLQMSPVQRCTQRASSSQECPASGRGVRTRALHVDRRSRQKPSLSNASSQRQSPIGRATAPASLARRYQPAPRASAALPGRHSFSAAKSRSQNISVRERMNNYSKERLHSRGRAGIRDTKQVRENIFDHDKSSSLWEYYLKSYLHESLLHKIKGDVRRSLES